VKSGAVVLRKSQLETQTLPNIGNIDISDNVSSCVLFTRHADVTVAVRGCCGARFQYGRTNGSVDQWDQMKDVTKLYSLDFDIQSGHNQ